MKENLSTGQQKRELLLSSALLLFTTRGFHGTPTSLIAKDAGVATGTLFHYFQTKEDLIESLYLEVKKEAGEAIRHGVNEGSGIFSRLKTISLNYVCWGVANPEKFQFMEQFCLSPYVSESVHQEGISHFLFLHDLITEGVDTGLLRPIPPDLIISLSTGLLNAIIRYILASGLEDTVETIFESAYQVIETGLKR